MTQVQVKSSSVKGTMYTVTFDENGPPTCTCTAFAIARNRAGGKRFAASCKHIDKVLASGGYIPATPDDTLDVDNPDKLAEALASLTLEN